MDNKTLVSILQSIIDDVNESDKVASMHTRSHYPDWSGLARELSDVLGMDIYLTSDKWVGDDWHSQDLFSKDLRPQPCILWSIFSHVIIHVHIDDMAHDILRATCDMECSYNGGVCTVPILVAMYDISNRQWSYTRMGSD